MASLSLIQTSCSTDQSKGGLILTDGNKDYPVLTLSLNDVATASYIPLKMGKDSVLLGTPAINRVKQFITKDKIFVADRELKEGKIMVYNHRGDPLYPIGKMGKGPGEIIGHIYFTVNTLAAEVLIWPPLMNRLSVYDTEGVFKREKQYEYSMGIVSLESINTKI